MLMKSPTAEPSLKNLSYVLRHKELWPAGFEWDFSGCSTCAIGLCHKLYGMMPEVMEPKLGSRNEGNGVYEIFITTTIKVPNKLFGLIPFGSSREYISTDDVTPEMVADRIDNWLAKP